ncbi:MAG: Zn-binding domain-containing protein, partial [Desulfurococcaceae archaeon]
VHRAGLPAEVRRDVEHKLRSGALQGVVATPTLELGVDIGSLDVVLLATLPPSFAKYLQRAGRAGRRRKGYIITVLGDDPIDSYFLRQPAKFFDQELTPSAIEPFNEEVIKAHLVAMLLQVGKENISNLPHHWRAVVNDLLAENVIKKIDQYVAVVYRIGHKYLAERGSIRSLGEVVEVVDSERGDVIATRELPLALLELYPGSIYICSKTPFRVIQFDAVNKKAVVKRLEKDQGLYTRPLYTVNVVGCAVHSERTTDIGLRARYAKVLLELLVDGYIVKSTYSGEVVSTVALEKPIKYRYTTRATLIKFPSPLTFTYRDSAEAFHAVEHSLISAARILCGASLTDLGGISYPSGDMVIYDSLIGGSGVSKLLYDKLDSAVITAREIMRRCKCSNGCPHCIYSPYCGNNNKVLSKKKATQVLDRLISRRQPIELYPLENRYGKPIA